MNKIITLFINLILLSTLNGADRAQGVDFALLGAYHPSHMAVTPQKAKEFEITIIRGYGSMYFRNESTQNQKKLALCSFATYNKDGSRFTDNISVLLHTLQSKDWKLAETLTDYKACPYAKYKNQNALHIALEEGAPITLLEKITNLMHAHVDYPITSNIKITIEAYAARYAHSLEAFTTLSSTFKKTNTNTIETNTVFALSFLNRHNLGPSIRTFLQEQADYGMSHLETLKHAIDQEYPQSDILSPILLPLIKETLSPSSELSNKDIRELFEYAIDAEDYDTFCLMHQNLSQPLPKEHIRLLLAKASVAQTKDSKKPFVRTILHNMGGKNLSNIAALALKTNDPEILQLLEKKKTEKEHKKTVALAIAEIKLVKLRGQREITHKEKRRKRETQELSLFEKVSGLL